MSADKKWVLFIAAALVLGAALRLSFPGDIEYKLDEKSMFDRSQDIAKTGNWPPLGLQTGIGGRHPSMGVWVFGVLTKVLSVSDPVELARGVQLLNILALVVLAFFSLRVVAKPEQEAWLWATAFAAVNPFAVIFQRKLWAPCTLPLFCILFWMAWHYRRTRVGAFFWGLLGTLLGQIHLTGFFLAGVVFGWTVWKDRQARWGAWVAGSVIGSIPLIPWIQYFFTKHENGFSSFNPLWILYPKYWLYWITDPFGLGLTYYIRTKSYVDFLRYPLIGDQGTYLVGVLNVVIVAVAVVMFLSWKRGKGKKAKVLDGSETGWALKAIVGPTGIFMTLSAIQMIRHYMIVAFPFEWVWMSRVGLSDPVKGRRLLAILWGSELLLTVFFMIYLHLNHGDPTGDYGIAYQFQDAVSRP